MKLYEIREESQPCSSWHVTKAAALQTLKDVRKEKPDTEIKMDTWDIDNTRKGIVEMLNQIAFRELFHPELIDQLEAWGLGEIAKKCPTTREWLAAKEAETPSVNPDTGEHDDAGRSAFDGAGGDCILCGRIYSGWGHNPEPVVPFEKGRCCGSCNTIKVIPTRVAMLGVNKA